MIYLNNKPIHPTMFPDKTSQVWRLDSLSDEVRWEFECEAELFHLAQLVELIPQSLRHRLCIPYLPYARQDKDVDNQKTFALRPFAKIINSFQFDSVVSLDAHSIIAEQVINNFQSIFPQEFIYRAMKECRPTILCYPDEGASIRYSEHLPMKHINATKVRDPSTGRITKTELLDSCKDESILIIDDICDGGRTFEMLSFMMMNNWAKSVNLYITHGIFSRGTKCLHDAGIGRIFTYRGEQFGSTYRPWE